MKTRRWRACARRWPVLALVLLTACGGGGGGDDATGDGDRALGRPLGAEVSCALTLSPSSVMPGEVVTVSGLPAEFTNPGMRVIAREAGAETIAAAFFVAPAEGERPTRFAAPIHPARPLQGGEVLIEIGDGQRRCPALPLQVGALPPAEPALMQTVLDKLAQWVDLQIRVMGGEPASVAAADRDSIEPSLIPLAVAKRLLGTPEQPGILRQQVAEAIAAGDPVVPAVMAAADLAGELDRAIAELQSLPIPVRPQAARLERKNGNPLCEGERLTPNPLPIHTAAELSRYMLAAGRGTTYQSNTWGQFLGAVGLTAGQEVGAVGGATAMGANVLGTQLYILKTTEAVRRALEPKTIDSFDVRRADVLMVEDRPASQPGRWENATVMALGEEFNVNEAALDGLISTVGLVPGPLGTAIGLGGVGFANQISEVVKELTREGCTRINAPRYGPIDVSEEDWTVATINGSALQRVDHRRYRGAEIGSAELEVRLRGEKFGVIGIQHRQSFNVVVNPQQLTLSPSSLRLSEPGQRVTLSASITNSEAGPNGPINIDRRILTLGEHEIRNTRIDGDFIEVDVQTSTRREDFPLRIQFTPLNPTLPGGGDRSRVAEIDLGGQLRLAKVGGDCLLPGSQAEFKATLDGFGANELGVDVQVTGGTLVSHDNDTPVQRIVVRAAAPGTLSVRATSRTKPSISDEVSVAVLSACLRKIQNSHGVIEASGNGVSSDGSEGCPESQDELALQRTRTEGTDPENIVLPPAIPPAHMLWFQREESISADYVSHITAYASPSGEGACQRYDFSGTARGAIRFYAEDDGTMGMNYDADLAGNCRAVGDALDGCAASHAIGVMNTMSYLEITEDTPVHIEGELQCSGMSGYIEMQPFYGIAMRYENGVTPYMPIGESLIMDESGEDVPPVLWYAECTQAQQRVPFSATVIFKAPRQVGGKDLITISGTGSVYATINGMRKDHFGPGIPPPTDDEVPPPPPEPPKTGDYASKAKVDFYVKVVPK